MPIYEYECKECGTRFEKVQPVTADPITVCENCGKGPVRRVFHPVGVIFKGSGWYITDSRNNSSKAGKGNSGKTEEASKSDKSDTAGSDSPGESSASTSTPPASE